MENRGLESLVSKLSQKAGVDEKTTLAIVTQLGLDDLSANLTASLPSEALRNIEAGDLKLAVKLGRSAIVS